MWYYLIVLYSFGKNIMYQITHKEKSFKKYRLIIVFLIFIYMMFYLKSINEWHFIDNINLIFHEAGHVVFALFGQVIQMFGGTLMQILVPVICFFYFYRMGDNFSFSIILFWIGQNLLNISVYAGDAINMNLPLLGGESVNHDWNWILSYLGILKYTEYVSSFFYITGIIIIIFALVLGIKYSFVKTYNVVT